MRTTPQGSIGYAGGGGLSAELDVMSHARTQVEARKDEMVAAVTRLMAQLETVQWKGDAAAAFATASAGWQDIHNRISSTLQSFSDSLGTNHATITQTELDNQASLGRLI